MPWDADTMSFTRQASNAQGNLFAPWMEVVHSGNINNFTLTNYYTKQQSDALNAALRNYTDSRLTDDYTKQESSNTINNTNLTKQNSFIVPYEVGVGSYKVVARAVQQILT